MSLANNNTEMRKRKHINNYERNKIEILSKEKYTAQEISERLGRSKRTIERELKIGRVELQKSDLSTRIEYSAVKAQKYHEAKWSNKGSGLKIGKNHELSKHIEKKIKEEKYSPDAVIGEIKEKGLFLETICTKTLYNYISQGIFVDITNKDLPVKRNKKKREYKKVRISHKNQKGTSIEERPKEVEKREEYGHWEMDCVVGKQGGSGAVLLVMSERKSREEIIVKMKDKTQASVKEVLDKLEKKYAEQFENKFKTITTDNGTEFLKFEEIEKSIITEGKRRVKMYYAHPYSSWERGTNENSNKLIRRFIPKGSDIGKVSKKKIKEIEEWVNNYPRRILGYKSAKEVSEKETA
jgi:IS30 family transposase